MSFRKQEGSSPAHHQRQVSNTEPSLVYLARHTRADGERNLQACPFPSRPVRYQPPHCGRTSPRASHTLPSWTLITKSVHISREHHLLLSEQFHPTPDSLAAFSVRKGTHVDTCATYLSAHPNGPSRLKPSPWRVPRQRTVKGLLTEGASQIIHSKR